MDTQDRPLRAFRPGAVVGGLVLLALGAGLLLDRSATLGLHNLTGPLVLIVLGSIMTLERGVFVCAVPRKDDGDVRPRRRQNNPGAGVWLIGIGIWILVSQNHLWGLRFETSWPLFIVFMGIMMVVRGWR